MQKLTLSTWVPIGLLGTIAGVMVTVGVWAGALQLRVTTVEAAVTKVEVKHEDAMKEFREMNTKLGEILGELKAIRPRKKGEDQ